MSAGTAWFGCWYCGCSALEPDESAIAEQCPVHAVRLVARPELSAIAEDAVFGIKPGKPIGGIRV